MTGRNWGKFLHDNAVFLTGIPLIIAIHWGWWRIQQNPNLVDPKDRRDLPIYSMYKNLYNKVLGGNSNEPVAGGEHEQSFQE